MTYLTLNGKSTDILQRKHFNKQHNSIMHITDNWVDADKLLAQLIKILKISLCKKHLIIIQKCHGEK